MSINIVKMSGDVVKYRQNVGIIVVKTLLDILDIFVVKLYVLWVKKYKALQLTINYFTDLTKKSNMW